MKIRIVHQINGDIYIGDAEDEDAPLLQFRFCNEFRNLPHSVKMEVADAARRVLAVEEMTQKKV